METVFRRAIPALALGVILSLSGCNSDGRDPNTPAGIPANVTPSSENPNLPAQVTAEATKSYCESRGMQLIPATQLALALELKLIDVRTREWVTNDIDQNGDFLIFDPETGRFEYPVPGETASFRCAILAPNDPDGGIAQLNHPQEA